MLCFLCRRLSLPFYKKSAMIIFLSLNCLAVYFWAYLKKGQHWGVKKILKPATDFTISQYFRSCFIANEQSFCQKVKFIWKSLTVRRLNSFDFSVGRKMDIPH